MNDDSRWSIIDDCPRYEVCDDGCVRNRHTGRILRPASDRDGYTRDMQRRRCVNGFCGKSSQWLERF